MFFTFNGQFENYTQSMKTLNSKVRQVCLL